MRKLVYLLVVLILAGGVVVASFILGSKFIFFPLARECINSGGEVTTALCCGSAGNFPNSCTIGSCGCSPDASHEVKSCNCGTGMCFNGTSCVIQG